MTIGEKIKLIRAEKNISLRNLAELTKLSKSTISDIENNKSKNPTKETLNKISLALGVSLISLLEETTQTHNSSEASISEVLINDNVPSKAFIRSVARAKDSPKETLDEIARFIDYIIEKNNGN